MHWIARTGVSILVLMELCIKTYWRQAANIILVGFNPCFNGTMYKNLDTAVDMWGVWDRFQSLF